MAGVFPCAFEVFFGVSSCKEVRHLCLEIRNKAEYPLKEGTVF